MDKVWYQKMFSRSAKADLRSTRAKADLGDAEAQFALGLKYSNGVVPPPDLPQAAQWYRKAANQNHALAQFNLGIMYAKGQGVAPDDAEALAWIRRAADNGDAGAQHNLGMRYHRASVSGQQGDAVESRIEAYKWLHLAAEQGYRGSDAACERVTLTMSRDEVAEANHRAAVLGPGKHRA